MMLVLIFSCTNVYDGSSRRTQNMESLLKVFEDGLSFGYSSGFLA